MFFKDSAKAQSIGAALAEQMENGLYDRVMSTADKMRSIDTKGELRNLSSIDMYNLASKEVNKELDVENKALKAEGQKKIDDKKVKSDAVAKEKAKIEKQRKEKAYTAKAEAEDEKANKARRKATDASQQKQKVAPTKKPNPLALDGEDLDEFVDGLMNLYR